MPNVRENWSTFRNLMERREFWASLVSAIVFAIIGFALFGFAEPHGKISISVPWKFVVGILVFLILAALYFYWILDYATEKRLQLRGLTNLEQVLDTLAEYLEEGNKQLLNATVSSEMEFGAWREKQKAWMKKVEDYLEANFGLRERNSFRHIVVLEYKLQDGYTPEHCKHRNIMAWKLLTIKEIILRHSERAAKLRLESA